MAVDFVEDRAGIHDMLGSPFIVGELHRRAELIRIEAERIAPVDTGAYAFGLPGKPGVAGGGFTVTSGVRGGVAYARVSNDVRRGDYVYAFALEFGTKYMQKQRPLGRAVDTIAARGI
ncbi:MAG TPA: hypothetical protein VK453_25380 [Micromonosporaceae bacterium]|nr:hypothetical protein [Micromonosporaceae bacterium]